MILGIIASQITSSPTPVWQTTALTSPSGTASLLLESMDQTAITAQLTANYPPGNYIAGYVMRVNVYNSEMMLIGTTYRIRGTV